MDLSVGECFEDLYDDLSGGPLGWIMSCAALLNFLNPGGDKDGCDDDLHDVGVEEWTAQFARSKRAYPQLMAAAVTETIPFYLHEGGKFPTTQRPEPQNLSSDPNEVINAWFSRSQITIEDAADTPIQVQLAKQLFYTWQDCFAKSYTEI